MFELTPIFIMNIPALHPSYDLKRIHTIYYYLSEVSDAVKAIFIFSTCFRWCKAKLKFNITFNVVVYIYLSCILLFSFVLALLICIDIYYFQGDLYARLLFITVFLIYVVIKLSFHIIYCLQLLMTSSSETVQQYSSLPYIMINHP